LGINSGGTVNRVTVFIKTKVQTVAVLQPIDQLNFDVISQIGLGAEDQQKTKNSQTQKCQSAVGDQKKPLTDISQYDFD
jgi:hypothetical protein